MCGRTWRSATCPTSTCADSSMSAARWWWSSRSRTAAARSGSATRYGPPKGPIRRPAHALPSPAPGAPCWWWSVHRHDQGPSAFAWLVAVVSLGLPWAGIALALFGIWHIARSEGVGWWYLAAGGALLIADV